MKISLIKLIHQMRGLEARRRANEQRPKLDMQLQKESFVDQIPPVIQEGLNQSGNLLPALGVAMLIQLTWDKKFGVFLFLGFALAAFLNVSTLGAAFFGAIAAVIYYMLGGKQAPAAALETQGAASEPIDDEDDEEL